MLYEPLMKFDELDAATQFAILSKMAADDEGYSLHEYIEAAQGRCYFESETGMEEFEYSTMTATHIRKHFTSAALEVIYNYYDNLRADVNGMIFTGYVYNESFVFDVEGMIYQICEDFKSAVEQNEKSDWLTDRTLTYLNMAAFEQAALSLGICDDLGL